MVESVRQQIIDLREQLNLSQQEFADKCGVPLESVQKWEGSTNGGRAQLTEEERKIILKLREQNIVEKPRERKSTFTFPENYQARKYKQLEPQKPSEQKLTTPIITPKTQELRNKIDFLLDNGFTGQKLACEISDITYENRGQAGRYQNAPISEWLRGESYPNEKELAYIDRLCKGFGFKSQSPADKGNEV